MASADCCCTGVTCPVIRVPAGDVHLASRIAGHGHAVLCFGPGTSAAAVRAALDALPAEAAFAAIVAAENDLEDYQELIDSDRIFYLSRGALAQRDLDRLIAAAARSLCPADHGAGRHLIAPNTLRRLALAQNLAELADAAGAAAAKSAGAERGRCLLFDRVRQMLWVPSGSRDGDTDQSAAVGLASYILRTGTAVCLPHAGDDRRFDRSLDDPDGDPSDRFLGVAAGGVAVLIALRAADQPPFEPADAAALEAVAAHLAPYLEPWVPGAPQPAESPFRERALREIELPLAAGPEPLRLEPKWSRRVSLLALAALAVALLALLFVRVPEYASGTAVVRSDGRTVAAFLPARHLPRLRRGMKLRFQTPRAPNQWLEIESVEPRASSAMVTAKLARADTAGARGRAEVRVGSEQLLSSLLARRAP